MNKKYMDFVPASPKSGAVSHVPPRPMPATKSQPVARKAPVKKQAPSASVRPASSTTVSNFSIKKEPEYGVIEDFRPKFVKTEVEKRPLSRSHFSSRASEVSQLKAKNLKKTPVKPVENNVEKSVENKSLNLPKTPFISQAKVTKRPLSKNVYEKKIKPTRESSKGPITIIDKPEKESKLSIVVTIIITIILGAAAGAIAFLLLPK